MLQYDRKKVGQFLKRHRLQADFTQADVAQKVGYETPQFISNIERGKSVSPLDLLGKLVRLYKADPVALERIILKSQREILVQKLKKYM